MILWLSAREERWRRHFILNSPPIRGCTKRFWIWLVTDRSEVKWTLKISLAIAGHLDGARGGSSFYSCSFPFRLPRGGWELSSQLSFVFWWGYCFPKEIPSRALPPRRMGCAVST